MSVTTQKNAKNNIKSNLSLYSLDYAEACNELAGPISASLRPGNTAPFEETSQQWRAVGNTVSNLTGPRFEPQTSRSRDECVTARPTGRSISKKKVFSPEITDFCYYRDVISKKKTSSSQKSTIINCRYC